MTNYYIIGLLYVFSETQTPTAAGNTSEKTLSNSVRTHINKHGDSEDQTVFELRSCTVKLHRLSARTLSKHKSLLVEDAVAVTVTKESGSQLQFEENSMIVDLEENTNQKCVINERYEMKTKTISQQKDYNSNSENLDKFSESGEEFKDFVNGIAENEEEDTQMLDKTETIGSIDTQSSICQEEDDYYQDDSFICDNDQLTEEYHLSDEKDLSKEESKLINPESLYTHSSEIVNITDSSSEDEDDNKDNVFVIASSDTDINPHLQNTTNDSHILIDLTDEDSSSFSGNTSFKVEARKNMQLSEESLFTENSLELEKNEETSQNVSFIHRKSLILQENIKIDDFKDSGLSQRIDNFINVFGSTIKMGKVSLNLSLEQKTTEESEENAEAVNSNLSKFKTDELSSRPLSGKIEDESVSKNGCSTFDEANGRNRSLKASLSEIITENQKSKRLKFLIQPGDHLNSSVCSSIREDMWNVTPVFNLKASTASATRLKPHPKNY